MVNMNAFENINDSYFQKIVELYLAAKELGNYSSAAILGSRIDLIEKYGYSSDFVSGLDSELALDLYFNAVNAEEGKFALNLREEEFYRTLNALGLNGTEPYKVMYNRMFSPIHLASVTCRHKIENEYGTVTANVVAYLYDNDLLDCWQIDPANSELIARFVFHAEIGSRAEYLKFVRYFSKREIEDYLRCTKDGADPFVFMWVRELNGVSSQILYNIPEHAQWICISNMNGSVMVPIYKYFQYVKLVARELGYGNEQLHCSNCEITCSMTGDTVVWIRLPGANLRKRPITPKYVEDSAFAEYEDPILHFVNVLFPRLGLDKSFSDFSKMHSVYPCMMEIFCGNEEWLRVLNSEDADAIMRSYYAGITVPQILCKTYLQVDGPADMTYMIYVDDKMFDLRRIDECYSELIEAIRGCSSIRLSPTVVIGDGN